jgi:UDP-glucose 4-epimerase
MSTNRKVLVTGGAGYIGSHVVKQLGEAGYDIVVYDNLSTGFAESVLYGELVVGDLKDVDRLSQVFEEHRFDAVLHFAASLIVPESVERPLDYYSNNTCNTLNLLRCCEKWGVEQLVFSSTAAVYGEPEGAVPLREDDPTKPINPYGRSKLMSEWIIQDFAKASNLRYVILRYFNVAGADSSGKLGQRSKNASHLIRVACDVVLGKKPVLEIFGSHFPTSDGTAVRDYIHVEDLASAHIQSLVYLGKGNESQILNCGYGHGFTVKEVIDKVKEVSGVKLRTIEVSPRNGDPYFSISNSEKIKEKLNFEPRYDDLGLIIKTFLMWEKMKEKELN